jgi:predicted branched-subunit amino acid permease
MLVFFAFMPIGIIVGAVARAVGLSLLATRDDAATRSGSEP